MRLARRALALMLTLLVLCAVASTQTLRPADDPRNIAPTVGTGGPPGGPTGLFTIYDGQTLRKGEFTFSFAYSNFDRDPGNVDIVEVPVSFQIGLSDHLELWFNTDAYRGIKVNNPQNLSSFYLPNSQLFTRIQDPVTGTFGPLGLFVPGAIILAPERVSGTGGIAGAVFRPAGNQPFVRFPFIGGAGPNFGLTGNRIAPPFSSRLGAPTGSGGNHGAADNFPGIGSVFGSILPGIVLTQRRIPANLTFEDLIVPQLFTVAPSYLPDAPFINRLYGESSFNTFTVGAKWRWTGPNNPFGIGIIPFYRFYADNADDERGFNQLQRGASPGAQFGDIGVIGFADGRLSKHVNLSANLGFIYNSNPKSEAMGDAVLLDRANELLAGVGIDVPINSSFQWIAELKSVQYVGGRTPNAFPNNPVDFLTGIRVFPARWLGMSAWYRHHLNQHGDRIFGGESDFPAGFRESEDPHGFGFQFFIGPRNPRRKDRVTVEAKLTMPSAVRLPYVGPTPHVPCPAKVPEGPACTPDSDGQVRITADVRYFVAPENDPSKAEDLDESCLAYTWVVLHAASENVVENVRVTPNATNPQEAAIDLSAAAPGKYRVRLLVEEREVDATERVSCFAFADITVERCPPPPTPYPLPTPSPVIDCPPDRLFKPGGDLTFTASVSNEAEIQRLDPDARLTYEWSVDNGQIKEGQGTMRIVVDTNASDRMREIRATVRVGYAGRTDCPTGTAYCLVPPTPPTPFCEAFDAYEEISLNDEKARLDNFANELKARPRDVGYYVTYGEPENLGRVNAARRRERAKDYLVNQKGIEADRIIILDAGETWDCYATILWTCPSGQPPLKVSEQQVVDALRARVKCPTVRGK